MLQNPIAGDIETFGSGLWAVEHHYIMAGWLVRQTADLIDR
jgi:hypothetical protein